MTDTTIPNLKALALQAANVANNVAKREIRPQETPSIVSLLVEVSAALHAVAKEKESAIERRFILPETPVSELSAYASGRARQALQQNPQIKTIGDIPTYGRELFLTPNIGANTVRELLNWAGARIPVTATAYEIARYVGLESADIRRPKYVWPHSARRSRYA